MKRFLSGHLGWLLCLSVLSVTPAVEPAAAHAQSTPRYREGDRIEMLSMGKWYPAVIKTVHPNGAYLIRYDDGTEMIEHASDNMRRVSGSAAAPEDPAPAPAAAPQRRAPTQPKSSNPTGAARPAQPTPPEPQSLKEMSLTDLGILATERFTEHPGISCPAAEEYRRRGTTNSKAGGVEVVLRFCESNGYGTSSAAAANRAAIRAAADQPPPVGRYVCLWLGGVGVADGYVRDPGAASRTALETVQNQVAPDIRLLSGGRYSTQNQTGTYTYDHATKAITWQSGPLTTTRVNWVGVFEPVGPTAKYPTLRIRSRRDVSDGNKRDLQWCNLAQ